MSPHIFDNLNEVEEVITEIDVHYLDQMDRDELVDLVKQILRHHTLEVVLDNLPNEKHEHFLTRYQANPEDMELLEWIRKEIKTDIETAVKQQSRKIKAEILREIINAKR